MDSNLFLLKHKKPTGNPHLLATRVACALNTTSGFATPTFGRQAQPPPPAEDISAFNSKNAHRKFARGAKQYMRCATVRRP